MLSHPFLDTPPFPAVVATPPGLVTRRALRRLADLHERIGAAIDDIRPLPFGPLPDAPRRRARALLAEANRELSQLSVDPPPLPEGRDHVEHAMALFVRLAMFVDLARASQSAFNAMMRKANSRYSRRFVRALGDA